jgi:hypothetical protein
LQAALSASGRAEASLSTLMRAIRDLSSGVSGAREANVQLMRELEAMSDLLGAANERQLALKNRVSLLEQSLERAHVEAQRERAYILDQQDAFIAAMMDDHEQVIAELYREIEAARHRPSQRPNTFIEPANPSDDSALRAELEEAKQTVEKLLSERDRARETLLKVQAQRDEAQAALVDLQRDRPGQIRISTSGSSPNLRNAPTLPPPETARPVASPNPGVAITAPVVVGGEGADERSPRNTGPQAFGSIRSLAAELEPAARDDADRMSPPPEELRAALHAPSSDSLRRQPPKRSLTPPGPPTDVASQSVSTTLSSPPNPTSARPGGYSVTNSIAPENVADAPRLSRAPRS